MFIKHIVVITVMMLFWDKWSNPEKICYQEFEFTGSAMKGPDLLLSMKSGWRGSRPQSMRTFCPPALSKTQPLVPESHLWKWMPEGQLSVWQWPLWNHPQWPGASSWPLTQQEPSPWLKLKTTDQEPRELSYPAAVLSPLRATWSVNHSGSGRSYHFPSSSRVREFRVPEIGWFP